MSKLDFPPEWVPMNEDINALPEPLRRYIHELETVCDPAGDVRELFRLKAENKMLRQECERLAAKAGEGPRAKRVARPTSERRAR